MFPVPTFDVIRSSWANLRDARFPLHGFFLYSSTDHNLPEYIGADGWSDLSLWTRNRCCLFVLEAPSSEWLASWAFHSRQPWWDSFYNLANIKEEDLDLLKLLAQDKFLVSLGEDLSISDLFELYENRFLRNEELAKILEYFELDTDQHPCGVFFRDIVDTEFWFVNMEPLVGLEKSDLRASLKQWFGGKHFRNLIAGEQLWT